MKRADAAVENYSSMLKDEELFGCPDNCAIAGCDEELDEVFGERELEYERFFDLLFVKMKSNI